jgi:hypothetical protein
LNNNDDGDNKINNSGSGSGENNTPGNIVLSVIGKIIKE